MNDACVLTRKAEYVPEASFRFEGQASVFATEELAPATAASIPNPRRRAWSPSCAEGGVLGVLPGVIGVIQATEALKLIAGIGEPLVGRFLIYDALRMRFRELKLKKDPDCPVCGTHPTVTKLIDYEEFCGVHPAAAETAVTAGASATEITSTELKARLDRGDKLTIVDVREPNEYQINQSPVGPHSIRRNPPPVPRSSTRTMS